MIVFRLIHLLKPKALMVLMFMFRLPVLTGAAGALGATYCPPYIAVDGSYNARPPGQISSTGSSRFVVLF